MMNAEQLKEFQITHIAAWNKRYEAKRKTLLQKIYADDIKMYDKDYTFDGLQAISDFIGKLMAEDPKFQFAAVKPIEPLQQSARLFGQIQTSGPLLNSMDFFIFENDKAKHLYAFLEPVKV